LTPPSLRPDFARDAALYNAAFEGLTSGRRKPQRARGFPDVGGGQGGALVVVSQGFCREGDGVIHGNSNTVVIPPCVHSS